MDTYEKLKKILSMCEFIKDNENNEDESDVVVHYQCVVPYKLLELQEDLLTMFE